MNSSLLFEHVFSHKQRIFKMQDCREKKRSLLPVSHQTVNDNYNMFDLLASYQKLVMQQYLV